MRTLFILFFLSCHSLWAWPQDWPLKKIIDDRKAKETPFIRFPTFSLVGEEILKDKGIYQRLLLDDDFLFQLKIQFVEALEISIPLSDTKMIVCELIKFDLGSLRFTTNNGQPVNSVNIPVCYRGIVRGEQKKNNVILTVNDDYLSLTITYGNKMYQITKADDRGENEYRLYNSERIQFPTPTFECGTREPSPESMNTPSQSNSIPQQRFNQPNSISSTNAPQDRCVYVFVECYDSLYQWRNRSYQQTINYVYELFNSVATGFLNEQINIKISQINVWTTTDPYRQDTRANALADLSANYQDNFWGNICVGLDFSINSSIGRSGLAGSATGRLKGELPNNCPAYSVGAHPFCYNDMNYNVNVQNFPTGPNTTPQQIYLVMHEMGHLLGSPHTQWCGWMLAGVPMGALDNCAAVEGTCNPGPPPPSSGGTIMSYCVGAGQFVNFNNGFGPIPGSYIRSFVENNGCLANCPSCPADVTVGSLFPGLFHYETSNTITANGIVPANTFAIFDAGVKVTLLPGFRALNGSNMKIYINGCDGIR